jgi:hypothetical protein
MLSLAGLRGYQPLFDDPTVHDPRPNESNVPPWLDIRRSYPPSFPTPYPGAVWEPDSTDPSQASASSTATVRGLNPPRSARLPRLISDLCD